MNSLPVIGWLLDLGFKTSMAVPFWIVWTKLGVGAKFFYFLPEIYLEAGFWETVGVFIVLGILKEFSPIRADSSSTSEANQER